MGTDEKINRIQATKIPALASSQLWFLKNNSYDEHFLKYSETLAVLSRFYYDNRQRIIYPA